MNAIDFEYADEHLSDFGFIICQFSSQSDFEMVSAGSDISFNMISVNDGKYNYYIGHKYESCLTTTFHICKDPDKTESQEIQIVEYRKIMRWLNRPDFHKFKIITPGYENICYYGSFNIQEVRHLEKVVGFELTFTTNRPFAISEPITKNYTISLENNIINIEDVSDEIGHLYPDMEITCLESGDLNINNNIENRDTYIANCTKGEIIKINGKYKIIESNLDSHLLYNDFNFNFFRLVNTYSNRNNKVTVSLPCKIQLRYEPIVKVGI